MIIKCFYFNENNEDITEQFMNLDQQCLAGGSSSAVSVDCGVEFKGLMSGFSGDDNVSSGFGMFMAFLLLLQIVCLLLIVVLNLLIAKFIKMRELDPISTTDYELHTM